MIDIKVSVQGEIDNPPFVKSFQYRNKEEELILFNTVVSIKKKIERGLKINVYETLAIFCAYVIEELKGHKSQAEIESAAQDIISSDHVLIGVPETLREMNFEVVVDDFLVRRLKFLEPMKIRNYMMT